MGHRCNFKAAKPTSGLLKGRSVVLKDHISVGGLPTTVGTFPSLTSGTGDYAISTIDSTVVSRLLSAGAVIKGTATCETFSASPLSFTSSTGLVHNAWAHGYTTGGSSSGCGALMGAKRVVEERGGSFGDSVDLAIGGDQGGSIRIPASYNGIYGLKPTHGLVPYTGAVSLSPMIDHLGPMATKLSDIAVILQVIAGYDEIDARMTPESPLKANVKNYPALLDEFMTNGFKGNELKGKEGRRLKVGLLKEAFEITGISGEVRDRVHSSAKSYFTAAGAEVVELSVPMHLEGPAIWTSSSRATMADLLLSSTSPGYLSYAPPHLDISWPPTQSMYDLLTATNPAIMNLVFSSIYLKDTVGSKAEAKAHRKIFELRAAYDAAFESVDVLVTPTLPTVSSRNPVLSDADGTKSSFMDKIKLAVGITANTSPFNCSGHPALSVPCGFGKSDAGDLLLPIGMQIIGRRWEDETVLAAAAAFDYGKELSAKL